LHFQSSNFFAALDDSGDEATPAKASKTTTAVKKDTKKTGVDTKAPEEASKVDQRYVKRRQ